MTGATTPATSLGRSGLPCPGGGFRAMLFHVGALVRLNELRLLRELDEVSGVSGGAIVAGRLAAVGPGSVSAAASPSTCGTSWRHRCWT